MSRPSPSPPGQNENPDDDEAQSAGAGELARARAAERRTAFLAEAGALLSSSLDYETTLATLARLVVPRLADWCAIDVVDDAGVARRVVTAHTDPAKEALAAELDRRYPPDPNATSGVPQVLRTGEPELVEEIPDELLVRGAHDEEHLRLARELQLRSYMVLPLIARGKTLGAITFVAAESGRRYGADDLAFAREVAGRAALAVDNARLYRRVEESRAQTTRILESIGDAFFALDPAWRFTYVNREAEKLLHGSREALLGQSVWDLFPEAVGSTFERMYRQAVEMRSTVEFEEFFPPLGTWFEVRAYPSESGLAVYFRDINERRRAQQELEYQSYVTRTITENATAAMFMMDARGRCTYMNPAAERMTGYTLAEIRDVPLHDAIHHHHPDGTPFPLMECPIDRALPEDFSIRAHEDVFIRKDGTFFPVLVAASPIFRESSRPVGTVIEVRDVTEERRAQEELRASERRFRFLADSIPVQVWTSLPDGRLDYVNQQVVDYFGRSEERILGEGWLDVVEPGQVALVTERWMHSLRSGEPYEVEFRLRRRDGEYLWHLARARAQRDAAGRIVRWFGSNTLIDDRKQAEADRERLFAALDSERTRLHEVFQRAPAFIAVLRGPDHLFETTNPAYQQIIGHREVVGRTVAEALPEVVEQGFLELLDGVYRTGEPFVGNELPILLQQTPGAVPEPRLLDFVYAPMREADGSVSGIFVHGVDVSDQVAARQEVERKAEELARLAARLEASNRELDQFAYVASHDLKAPLRGIANLSQWLEEDLEEALNPEAREQLELLRGRVHRMEGLIDGILQYSRAGRVREQPEPVEVAELLREVVDLLAPPEGVRVEIGPGMPRLLTERLPLQQVFLNLLGNAVKYTRRDDALVRVGVRELPDGYEFSVSDNGPGIAPEYHERIFGIFQTLEARDKVEGTGIGLSLVKKIVEHRGGHVQVESAEGAGATFRFLWPRIREAT